MTKNVSQKVVESYKGIWRGKQEFSMSFGLSKSKLRNWNFLHCCVTVAQRGRLLTVSHASVHLCDVLSVLTLTSAEPPSTACSIVLFCCTIPESRMQNALSHAPPLLNPCPLKETNQWAPFVLNLRGIPFCNIISHWNRWTSFHIEVLPRAQQFCEVWMIFGKLWAVDQHLSTLTATGKGRCQHFYIFFYFLWPLLTR